MEYYAILILIAVLVLLGSLAFIGVKMTSSNNSAPYPPIAYACPDYWKSDDKGNCTAGTMNVGGLYTGYTMQPEKLAYTGLTAICAKQKWAQNNNVVWTGISEYNQCG
jgi:hypothetical protein